MRIVLLQRERIPVSQSKYKEAPRQHRVYRLVNPMFGMKSDEDGHQSQQDVESVN